MQNGPLRRAVLLGGAYEAFAQRCLQCLPGKHFTGSFPEVGPPTR